MNETFPPDRAPDPVPLASFNPDAGKGTTANGPVPQSSSSEPSLSQPAATQGEVGDALRSIYQRMIEENVPDEMIDLLGRLD